MNVKELKKLLEKVDDEAIVVQTSSDHSYWECDLQPGTALYDGLNDHWTEDHGEKLTPEAEYGKRLKVLIVQ